MEMIGYQGPGVTCYLAVGDYSGQALDKVIAVDVAGKYLTPFDPTADDMVQRSGRVDSGFSWHSIYLSYLGRVGNAYYHHRPPIALSDRKVEFNCCGSFLKNWICDLDAHDRQ
jgi:hypothetical protein